MLTIQFVHLTKYAFYTSHHMSLSPCRLYNKMAMEVILSTAFGRAVDVQGGKGGKLFQSALAVFNALAPPKENESINVIRILQFFPSKLQWWPFLV